MFLHWNQSSCTIKYYRHANVEHAHTHQPHQSQTQIVVIVAHKHIHISFLDFALHLRCDKYLIKKHLTFPPFALKISFSSFNIHTSLFRPFHISRILIVFFHISFGIVYMYVYKCCRHVLSSTSSSSRNWCLIPFCSENIYE